MVENGFDLDIYIYIYTKRSLVERRNLVDARTSVAKDLAQISRQDNAAMWSSPNPDSPEIPSTLFPLSLRGTTKCRANSFSLSNQSIDYPITRVIHFTSFIPNSEIETVKLYTILWTMQTILEQRKRKIEKNFRGGGENKSLKKRDRRRRTKGNKREREEWKRNEKERRAGYNYLGDRIRPLPSLSPPARSRAWRQQSANALMETSVIRVYSLCTSNYPFPRVESRSCPRMEGGLPSGEQSREERGSRR